MGVYMLFNKNRKLLLNLSRRAIEYYFDTHQILHPDLSDIPYEICEKKGVFITLYYKNQIRGRTGYIDPIKDLWEAVIENSVNVAFFNHKFKALDREELDDITIEISIISPIKKIIYNTPEELLKRIEKGKGILIKKGMHSASFLPDAWDYVDSKADFLDNLCLKSKLKANTWELEKLEIYSFDTETFGE